MTLKRLLSMQTQVKSANEQLSGEIANLVVNYPVQFQILWYRK